MHITSSRIGTRRSLNVVFKVQHVVTLLHDMVETPIAGNLYFLKPGHYVIDAVGKFICRDVAYLVFLQISLMPYSAHWSNIRKETRGFAHSMLTHYRKLFHFEKEDPWQTIYVYISPREIGAVNSALAAGHQGVGY